MADDNCRGPVLIGKTMNEGGLTVRGTVHSPDSDCNSNHPESANCLSNASSQDIDFIQDNSDYQWFVDYGYRDGSSNHHTSILSLPESYDAGDIKYYEVLAKNMDANLAEVDIESFRTEDIHALLTTLPPMCTDHFSQDSNRQGECCASMSGSLMAKFDFDSPHSSSQGEESANSNSMSICKSELLFSPVKEVPMPGANFSVDSLDCDLLTEHDIMLTCQANKDNYTIAFEGSMTMYSEDSDYHETDKSDVSGTGSAHWPNELRTKVNNLKALEASMSQSDSGSFTTWSKLKKRSSENQLRRHPSGNNNQLGDDTSHFNLNDNSLKSQSMPNLYKQKIKGMLNSNYVKKQCQSTSSSEACTIKRVPVRVFDIQHQIQNSSGSGASMVSDMATSVDTGSSASENANNKQHNFSLVKLFMKQKSLSAEGMSVGLDQSSNSENWPGSGESTSSDHKNTFESTERRINDSGSQVHDQIIEEREEEVSRSESVEQLSESISKIDSVDCSTENEQCQRYPANPLFNMNNNNSIGQDEIKNTQHKSEAYKNKSKTSRNCIPIHLINRSMQTSHLSDLANLKNTSYKLNSSNSKGAFKVIEPSFLSKLKKEGETQKPVYVLYPSYALPNLDFLKQKEESPTKVYLVPQKAPVSNVLGNKKRPFSCNDVEALKKKGFSHIQDWDSLNILLPCEYRQILADVPEVAQHMTVKEKLVKQRRRPLSSDYAAVLERTQSLDRGTNISSSSSTGTQPSSGYRGSSTMLLTDSQNSPAPTSNLNPLFVYRYDSVTSSEASLMASERQRSITTTAPPLPKRSISLQDQANRIDSVPPRPPLPKGILRKSLENNKLRRSDAHHKRYSMIVGGEEQDEMVYKRRSLQEPYYLQRNKRLSETEDEGVDAGTSSSSLDEHVDKNGRTSSPDINMHFLSHISNDELIQLEEFLKLSGISSSEEDLDENGLLQLRSYVKKFLSLKINQEGGEYFGGKKNVSFAEKVNVLPKVLEPKTFTAPNNSPNVSAFMNQRHHQTKTLVDMPICEESEGSPENCGSPQRLSSLQNKNPVDLVQKRSLISAVTDAVEQLIHHFSPATNQSELTNLGDSSLNPACAKLALSALCPALYAVLSDGLKPSLETSFGAIPNSVWQLVESSAQQGPLTKSLHELVMRINGEDAITEGLVKFNAFVFGLLNVRSLDAWASYLRTRESVLRKHYNSHSLLLMSHTGGASVRSLVDTLIATLQPLALLPFHFDLLFEYRQLHLSLKRMDSYQQVLSPTKPSPSPILTKQWNGKLGLSSNSNRSSSDCEDTSAATTIRCYTTSNKVDLNNMNSSPQKTRSGELRPKSCVDIGLFSKPNFRLNEDVTRLAKKRWSGISLSSKLYQAYDKLAHEDEEEYTDSLEATTQNMNKTNSDDEKKSSNENVTLLPEDGPESLDSNLADDKPINGKRFKKLQRKWEMLSGTESPPTSPTHSTKSKIPRPLTSPIKPSGIPLPLSAKKVTSPNNNKKITSGISRTPSTNNLVKNNTPKKCLSTRTSRVDQMDNTDSQKHPARPSSLPYKPSNMQNGKSAKTTPPRRAVSSSLSRRQGHQSQTPKFVKTISHRLPSESGHLSHNEGERLKVVLEVDDNWLLCCRGNQKGLVSRSAIIPADSDRF